MCKTVSVSVLAFLAGVAVGAMALNRASVAQEPTPKARVQPPRGDDEPRPERRRIVEVAPQPPRGEGRPGMGGMGGMMMGGPTQITATGKFVYILRGNEILQFHAESMEFIKKATVPPPERRDPPPPRDGDDRRDRNPPPPRDPE